ncbi:protein DYAD isoform X2 [Argentina anserina]|uniref:protein DYAD isoform X2 n=1 Tax=Argentina anserina TaxID=57926 RepID=UPI0021762A29|nr:protein DYAD isoform X2 [Potentilla anserina]
MAEWGVRRRVAYLNQNNLQVASSISKEEEVQDSNNEVLSGVAEDSKDEVLRAVKSEALEIPEPKRRCLDRRSKDVHATLRDEKRLLGRRPMKRNDTIGGRWTVERYKRAEESLFNVLEAQDATFTNPIARADLRLAARKKIGDTGLIDHLLKHIDGTIGPCGTKRLRRWFNHNGIMEYWLESAELADIRKEAGHHPYWYPQGCGPYEHYNSSEEVSLLKAELDKMKSDMQELLVSKKQEKDQISMLEDLVKWKAQIEESLKLNLGSWKGIQDKLGEFMIWKASVEQQLLEFTNVTSNMQVEKQFTATKLVASERWEDWLDSDNVDNFQGNELLPWFENTIPINTEEEVIIQHPHSSRPDPPLDGSKTGDSSSQDPIFTTEEMAELERERHVPRLEWETQTKHQANVILNSSSTASSKSDVDNLHLFQELFSWKSQMEQKVSELSNIVSALKKT